VHKHAHAQNTCHHHHNHPPLPLHPPSSLYAHCVTTYGAPRPRLSLPCCCWAQKEAGGSALYPVPGLCQCQQARFTLKGTRNPVIRILLDALFFYFWCGLRKRLPLKSNPSLLYAKAKGCPNPKKGRTCGCAMAECGFWANLRPRPYSRSRETCETPDERPRAALNYYHTTVGPTRHQGHRRTHRGIRRDTKGTGGHRDTTRTGGHSGGIGRDTKRTGGNNGGIGASRKATRTQRMLLVVKGELGQFTVRPVPPA
jgi:hypothetical protein